MRIFRYGLIILAALVAVVLLWFFKPMPPSDLKGGLYGHAYLAGMVKIRHLWDRPFTSIISSIPGGKASLPPIPFFLRPILPQAVELYILSNKEGGGRALAIDLGWRSRLFRVMHGFIIRQIQYRGVGAIEGKYVIRTPAGLKLLVYQDAGTLFVAEGEGLISKILKPSSDRGPELNIPPLKGLAPQVDVEKDIAYIAFSNSDMEFTKVIEDVEKEKGFLILPSVSSIKGGSAELRYASGNTLVAEISLVAREGGDIEGIEGDIGYLLDLLDRFLSTRNLKTELTINKENSNIMAHVMIHPANGGAQ